MSNNPWAQVRKNQLNKSSSKFTYGFPHSQRFRPSSRALCDKFYDIPSKLGKAPAGGIGYGKKVSFMLEKNGPSPQSYKLKSYFDGSKSISFGLGRQKIKQNGIFSSSSNSVPQPGHYEVAFPLVSKNGITMHSKLNYQQPSFSKNPGPADYQNITKLNSSGRYALSKMTNCSGPKIIHQKQHSLQILNRVPGPGNYQNKENLNESGSYFNSKYQSSRCRTFSKGNRQVGGIFKQVSTPGPGNYNCFSQFGCRGM